MKIRQLMEGQKEQIAQLRPSSPVQLFYPTDVQGAVELLRGELQGQERMVMPSLKASFQLGDVIVKFWGRGKDLEAPREARRNRREQALAAELYPESYEPVISFSLLSQRPRAWYKGPLSAGNVEAIFINNGGRPEQMSVEEFTEMVFKQAQDAKRQRMG